MKKLLYILNLSFWLLFFSPSVFAGPQIGLSVTCPPDVLLPCNSALPAPNTTPLIGISDCPSGSITFTHESDIVLQSGCLFVVERIYSAMDACGNQSFCSHVISIPTDTQLPFIACPSDILNLPCNSAIPGIDFGLVNAFDNCGIPSISHGGDQTNMVGCNQVTTRTYIATDGCANQKSCTQLISIPTDTDPPVLSCPVDATLACNTPVPPAIAAFIPVSDNCPSPPIVTFIQDDAVLSACELVITRNFRATDACGNISDCFHSITIPQDFEAPLITGPPDLLMPCNGELPPADLSEVSATDNCTAPLTIVHESDINIGTGCSYVVQRTYSATDACNNQSTHTYIITIPIDTVIPFAVAPPQLSQTIPCSYIDIDMMMAYVNGTISSMDSILLLEEMDSLFFTYDLLPDAQDLCSDSYIINTGFEIVGFTTIKFPKVGSIIGHFFAVDECGNVSEELISSVHVDDYTFPEVTCQNLTVMLNTDGTATITPEMLELASSDNCGPVFLTLSMYDFNCEDVGVNALTLYATDLAGNTKSCASIVTVNENILSGLLCPSDLTVSTDHDLLCTASIAGLIAQADACEELVITNNSEHAYNAGADASGIYPGGNHIITWTGDDGNGNIQSCSTILSVVDNTAPVALCKNITVALGNNGGIVPAIEISNGSYDNCDGSEMTHLIDGAATLSLSCISVGNPHQATLTVIDSSGNSASCSSTVTVPSYPVAQNLTSLASGDGFLLSWNAVSESVVCQIKGGPEGGGDFTSLIVWGDEVSNKFIGGGSLTPGASYQWKVRCACSANPLVVGDFSAHDIFTVPANAGTELPPPGVVEKNIELLKSLIIYPNPNNGKFSIITDMSNYEISILDLTGKLISVDGDETNNLSEIDMSYVGPGVYFIRMSNSETILTEKIIVE